MLTGEGNSALELLFDLALKGELPRTRPLKPWEVEKLSPQHLDLIMGKACGVPQRTLAAYHGYTESHISQILNHPDARYLISRIMAFRTEGIADIQKRMEALVPIALDTLTDIMLDGKEDNKVKIAFGILDRKGYGIKQESKVTHEFQIPQNQALNLTSALREAREIPSLEYADYTLVTEEQSGSSSDGSDGGQPVTDGSVPPATGSQASSEAA